MHHPCARRFTRKHTTAPLLLTSLVSITPEPALAQASPFMTGPSLQALFEAKKQGYEVDDGVVVRAIRALERCRGSTGC